jgi:type II secretory pathway component PulF
MMTDQAPTGTPMPPGIERLLLAFGLIGAGIAATMPYLVVPLFKEMFADFGAALPLPTRFVVDYYKAACIFPPLVLAGWFFWPRQHSRSVAACTIGLSSLVLVALLLMFAMYLPFCKLVTPV